MSVSKENKEVARTAVNIFGGKPYVFKYRDDNQVSSIDILSCEDKNFEGVLSYSTLGLSDFANRYEENTIPLRVELVGASDFECFPNILATCAFNIINSNFECTFGTIFKDVVKMYLPNSSMKHILFLSPYLWGDKFNTKNFEKKEVAWLMAIPISEQEKHYADNNGVEALEELLFELNQINVFDLERTSVR
ncbi:suppressor of fused domain protein [Rossellomorea vietnamensis]|uniref:Suppressor of fused domain protein n=1 Tax=Rossellomorea vietnamensis TaxID=218284 RepID=A0A6I6UUU7_9BACI|nr:suppressor of fused domain protein [Rossellomorea vietnamensis]QHE62586.1 suppressor of fused domain protein [Rossellomorea vietnamensis]